MYVAVTQLRMFADEVESCVVDLCNVDDIKTAADEVNSNNNVTILINNAGVLSVGGICSITDEQIERLLFVCIIF